MTLPFGQNISFDEVKAWVECNLKVNMVMVVEETQGGIYRYAPALVDRIDSPTKGRLYVTCPPLYAGSATFYKTGQHCRHPKGQTRLLPPIGKIRAAALDGTCWSYGEPMGISWFHENDPVLAALRERLRVQPEAPQ